MSQVRCWQQVLGRMAPRSEGRWSPEAGAVTAAAQRASASARLALHFSPFLFHTLACSRNCAQIKHSTHSPAHVRTHTCTPSNSLTISHPHTGPITQRTGSQLWHLFLSSLSWRALMVCSLASLSRVRASSLSVIRCCLSHPHPPKHIVALCYQMLPLAPTLAQTHRRSLLSDAASRTHTRPNTSSLSLIRTRLVDDPLQHPQPHVWSSSSTFELVIRASRY